MKYWMTGAFAAVLALALFTLPGGGATTANAAADTCGNDFIDVPDSGATFNFTEACMYHDLCYADGGTEADRRDCDNQFRDAMIDSCEPDWPSQRFQRRICTAVANTYYLAVRIGGWVFFPYGPGV